MKKFNRAIHKTMGEMPPEIRAMVGNRDMATATVEFNSFMTQIATAFHNQLASDVPKESIKLIAPGDLFGQSVSLEYVASGSIGSVYKIRIGDKVFAFKINRSSTMGELAVMPLQKRVRGLVNKAHIGSVFKFGERKYSWVLSDFVENNRVDSFNAAMEKLYFAYITKGVHITDAHPNNFKDGKLIDIPSLGMRNGALDDIKNLSRVQIDIVKKMANCIKTDGMERFKSLVLRATKDNPAVIKYMFYAMKFARGATFAVGKTDAFSIKLRKYEDVIDSAKRLIASKTSIVAHQQVGARNK